MSTAAATTRPPSRTAQLAATLAPVAGVIAVLVVAAITTPDLYESNNLTLILFLAGLIGVTAVGQTIVLLTGGIDLSIGAVIGLTTVIVATQTDGRGSALPGAIALAILGGAAVLVGVWLSTTGEPREGGGKREEGRGRAGD